MAHKCDGCRYKGEHQEMKFRPIGICNRGADLAEAVRNYEAEKCPYKKTNADRIRAMSDEEQLAEFLSRIAYGRETPWSEPHGSDIVWWLQKPAEEDDIEIEPKPCPLCGAEVKVHGPMDWKPTFYDPDSGGDPVSLYCECGISFSIGSYDYQETYRAWNRRSGEGEKVKHD